MSSDPTQRTAGNCQIVRFSIPEQMRSRPQVKIWSTETKPEITAICLFYASVWICGNATC